MTELKVNWSRMSLKKAATGVLTVALCAALVHGVPVSVFASSGLKAVTAGNGVTAGNAAEASVTPADGTATAGNGTEAGTQDAATGGAATGTQDAATGTQGAATGDTTVGNTTVDNTTEAEAVTIASVTLSKTSYTYDGKVKKPSVKVKDSNGNEVSSDNYKVTYSNNKSVGTATVKVTAKGNATGSKSATFTIKPKKTSITKIQGTSKGFKVTWKKQATQTTGYQIRYSTTSKFTSGKTSTVTLTKNTTTSKTVSKLSASKKYYVQVRTYKTVSGKKYYSAWSDTIIVTTKK
jgi:hypothetical protein